MKKTIKSITPKWLHYLYNRIISKRIILNRHSNWFDVEWKQRANLANEDEWKRIYDLSWEHWSQSDLSESDIKRILSKLPEEGKILDVGCGDGFLLSQIHNGVRELYGVDLSERALALARQRIGYSVQLSQASIDQIPYTDDFFDVVVCTHTLEHVKDLTKAVSELKRVAKKRLLVLVPSQEYLPYTDDYHIQFFPGVENLALALTVPEICIERYSIPAGQCAYQGDVFFMVWDKS